jgi:hypothetical protein
MAYAHIHRFHQKKQKKRGNKCVFGELFAKIKRWDLCYREKKLERPKILKIMKLRKAKNIKMNK